MELNLVLNSLEQKLRKQTVGSQKLRYVVNASWSSTFRDDRPNRQVKKNPAGQVRDQVRSISSYKLNCAGDENPYTLVWIMRRELFSLKSHTKLFYVTTQVSEFIISLRCTCNFEMHIRELKNSLPIYQYTSPHWKMFPTFQQKPNFQLKI